MSRVKLMLIAIAMTALTACAKTVQWEEEVLLNTGETIIVKRSVPWELQGGSGNPLDIGMRPNVDQQILQFIYKGKNYSYSGGAAVRWIVISKDDIPNLIAPASDWNWSSRNFYYCVVPFYVQFKPTADGQTWSWPKEIEPWLYGHPYNLMVVIPKLDEQRKKRYVAADRLIRDNVVTRDPQLANGLWINATYKSTCAEDPATWNLPKPTWTQK